MALKRQPTSPDNKNKRTVIYLSKGSISFIRLNRPEKLNAQNSKMAEELISAFTKADMDSSTKVLVFCGEGRAFCAGHDLAEANEWVSAEKEYENIEALQEITKVMMNMGKPIVAAVQGYALGSGCEWVMNADFVLAAEGTKFGFPETSLGSAVGNGSAKLLPIIVGLLRAKEMMLLNRIIDENEAMNWGLVNRVCPAKSLLKEATVVAGELAKHPHMANRLAKLAINKALSASLDGILDVELTNMLLTNIITRDNRDNKDPKRSGSFKNNQSVKRRKK